MRPEILLAIRRLMRTKKIFFFIVLGIAFATGQIIFADGFLDDARRASFEGVSRFAIGNIVIRPEKDETYIKNIDLLVKKLEALPGIKSTSRRLEDNGLMVYKDQKSNVALFGIRPTKEIVVTGMDNKIIAGSFLDDSSKNDILIGGVKAEILDLNVGDKVDMYFRNNIKKTYNIKGIFLVGVDDFDRNTVFILNSELEEILGLEKLASRVLIRLKDGYESTDYKFTLLNLGVSGQISTDVEESQSMINTLEAVFRVSKTVNLTSLLIAAIMIGIILYIEVIETMREIGILKAIGTQEGFIIRFFITQALCYSILGSALGVFFGYLACVYFTAHPIFIPVTNIYYGAAFSWANAIKGILITDIAALLAAIYPAHMASKVNIVEAMRVG